MDADDILHSIAFGPVQATLVDKGRKGSVLGSLAASWEANSDFTAWDFTFREGLTYETGEAVRPRDLVAAWNRLRSLMRRKGSSNPVFDKLAADGITCDERTVRLRFREPVPNLLTHVSDEMLALPHPSCYDPKTGGWRCGRKPISSGPYRVSRWDDTGVELRLRTEYPPALRHPDAFETVRIVSDRGMRDGADIVYGLSRETDRPEGTRFFGGMDSAVAYLRCQSWSMPGSPCHDRARRRRLRGEFYRQLGHKAFSATRSFFPPAIPGIRQPGEFEAPAGDMRLGTVVVRRVPGPASFLSPAYDALEAAVRRLGGSTVPKATSQERRYQELTPGLPRYENDLVLFMTEITLDDPRASVRFMFTSKEGARLPDPTGRIASELRRADFDLQKVNELLWDDAVIWPVAHAGFGVWVRDRVDVSRANAGSVITPIAWVGVRD